jgi:flagellar basal-body rod protein FlgF
MEAITANLANVDTPGYKRVTTGTRAFDVPGSSNGETELYTHSVTDFVQGSLTPSSSPYHLGLMGEGFFAVDGPNGELLTRSGNFRVDQAGILQSDEGYPVSWMQTNGPIVPNGEMVLVDATGRVRQGQKDLGQIKITSVQVPDELEKLGQGYYRPLEGNFEVPATATVYQNQLEGSNVSSIDELVAMITVQRSFESAKNVMSMIDQSYAKLMQIR